jgi:predicted RNA-binding Zn ribbon-like protein
MQTRSESTSFHTEELCLRFVNTMAWRLRDPHEERLPTPDALLHWLGANGLGSGRYVAQVRTSWQGDDAPAKSFYGAALDLREAIYGVFHAQIERRAPPDDALARLNTWLTAPAPGIVLAASGAALGWQEASLDADPRGLLRPIALSAASLMTGPRGHKLRQCRDDRGCGWLFVDESRAQNRRWCAMEDCGNRAKAARYRARAAAKRD